MKQINTIDVYMIAIPILLVILCAFYLLRNSRRKRLIEPWLGGETRYSKLTRNERRTRRNQADYLRFMSSDSVEQTDDDE